MYLLFFGAPGVGKGTQAKLVSKQLKIAHISTGDMLRQAMKDGTDLGKKAAEIMAGGKLVPDDLMLGLIQSRISESDCNNGFILDGFPRTLVQAEELDKLISELELGHLTCIEIVVPDKDVIERLVNRRLCEACGTDYNLVSNPPPDNMVCVKCDGKIIQRKDDNYETISSRLSVYHEQTAPLRDFYQNQGNYFSIDGSKSIDMVQTEIFSVLDK